MGLEEDGALSVEMSFFGLETFFEEKLDFFCEKALLFEEDAFGSHSPEIFDLWLSSKIKRFYYEISNEKPMEN